MVLYEAARARNCLVFGNTASDNGGGGALISTAGRMENCTVTSNTVAGSDDNGGGVFNWNSAAWVMDNSIVHGNTAPSGGTNNDVGAVAGAWAVMGISNCCSSVDLNALRPGINTGNIANPPQFMYDYRLERASPCVNTGANRDWMNGATDLQGYRRILERIVDMGAYESMPPGGMIINVY